MVRDNLLVRHLDACEKMGYVTDICCGATGMLTMNRMTVTQCFIMGRLYETVSQPHQIPKKTMDLLILSIGINCSYSSNIVVN